MRSVQLKVLLLLFAVALLSVPYSKGEVSPKSLSANSQSSAPDEHAIQAFLTKQSWLRQRVPHPGGVHIGAVSGSSSSDPVSSRSKSSRAATASLAGSPVQNSATTMDTGYTPTASVTGDFNGDGNQDWATAMYGDNTVWVYMGNGDGTWKEPEILSLRGSGPVAIATADLRHQGRVDLVVAESDSSSVGVLLSDGDGTYQPDVEYALPGPPLSVVAADFNGDGKQDVVIGNSGAAGVGPLTFLAGNGSGVLAGAVYPHVTGNTNGAQSMEIGDFNKDGKLDVIVFDDLDSVFLNSTAYVEQGNGDGTFQRGKEITERQTALASIFITAALVSDFNQDGCLDTVVVDSTGSAQVYLGNCDGTFTSSTHPATLLGDSPFAAVLADMNGDGNLDLVTGGAQFYGGESGSGANGGNLISIAFGDGKGGFVPQAKVFRTGGANIFGLAVTTLNRAGVPDVIAPSALASTLSVLLNGGNGAFPVPTGSSDANFEGESLNVPTSAPVVADLNGDGLADLAVLRPPSNTLQKYTVAVMLQNTDGTFAAPLSSDFFPGYTPTTEGIASSYAFGNFRGSGVVDMIGISNTYTNQTDAQVGSFYYSKNDGHGNFGTPSVLTTPATNGLLGTGDFNGDGKLDFVAAGSTSSGLSICIFLGNGDGTFIQQQIVTLPLQTVNEALPMPSAVYVGDFNHDSKLDVLALYGGSGGFVDMSTGLLFEFLGDGKGGFSSSKSLATGFSWINVADLNHDGCPDIVAEGVASSRPSFAVYLCQANGTFAGPTLYPVYVGYPGNSYNLPAATTPSQPLTLAPLLGDFDGDGNTDVAMFERDALTGQQNLFYATGKGDGAFTPHLLRQPLGTTLPPQYSGDIKGNGILGLIQLDQITFAVNAAVGNSSHAIFGLQFRALPVSGNEGHLRLFLDAPAVSEMTFSLSSDNAALGLPSQVMVPKGATTQDIDFSLPSTFDYGHAFLVTATLGSEHHQSQGYAVKTKIGAVALSPSILDFGVVEAGVQSAPQTVTVTNFGSATFSNLKNVLFANAYGFSILNDTCGVSLNAGTSCTVQIASTPPIASNAISTSERMYGSLVASGDGGSAAIWAWAYRLPSGVSPSPAVSLSATAATFPSTVVGKSATPQTITLTNSGTATLTLTSISSGSITGTGASSFSTTNTCGTNLAAGDSCSVDIKFTPTTLGSLTATLSIADDASNSPQTVSLTGVGIEAGSYSLSASSLSVNPGASGTSTVTATGANGYSGTITLTACTLASSPTAAIHIPTCTIGTSTITIATGATSATGSVSINTTASSASATRTRNARKDHTARAVGTSGLVLSGVFALCFPFRRSSLRSRLGLILLATGLCVLSGCGSGGGATSNPPAPGTTAGDYTFTVSGNDAAGKTATANISVIVE